LTGIQLGQGNAIGEAFVSFQRYARDLANRGVILAVCSKNEEKNALEPFEKHPEMVLKTKDIACFMANWNDKASNLKLIAKRLNIGLDSLVFMDDNPFERNQVRKECPQVAVPEMPEDPALYSATLVAAGYFESVTLTQDDLARTEQYRMNLEREKVQASFSDMSAYLKSLEMVLFWGPFDPFSLPRVTQLINKTNQFNLTTRRYSEEDTARFAADPNTITLRCRLTDRFGDNGIIGVIIAMGGKGGDWDIDTWLMSCRVLGRGVEQAMLDLLIQEVLNRGGNRLVGFYIPTAKNAMVREHYPGLGFRAFENYGQGDTRWALDLESKRHLDYSITLKKEN
jgi:FkbH-like protein